MPRTLRALACAVVLWSAPLGAQPADAEALIREGLELRRSRRDAEALAVFLRAWQSTHSGRALAQVGFAEQALGRWVEAEAHLREALSLQGDPWVTSRRDVIESSLAEIGRRLGDLEVVGGDEGAEVLVDGRLVGRLPLPTTVRVPSGTIALEVRSPGRITVRRPIEVRAGETARERVALVDAPPATTPPTAEATPSVRPLVVTQPRAPGPTRGRAANQGATLRVLGFTAAGGAALSLGLGALALALRNDAAERWNDPSCLRGGATRQDNCAEELARVERAEGWMTAGFVVGGALAVTSVVLLLAAPRGEPPERSVASLRCGPGPGMVGMFCEGAF